MISDISLIFFRSGGQSLEMSSISQLPSSSDNQPTSDNPSSSNHQHQSSDYTPLPHLDRDEDEMMKDEENQLMINQNQIQDIEENNGKMDNTIIDDDDLRQLGLRRGGRQRRDVSIPFCGF